MATTLKYTIETDREKFTVSWEGLPMTDVSISYRSSESRSGVYCVNYTYSLYNVSNSATYEHSVPLNYYGSSVSSLTINIIVTDLKTSSTVLNENTTISLKSWTYISPWSWTDTTEKQTLVAHLNSGEAFSYFKSGIWNSLINKVKEMRDAAGCDWLGMNGFNNYSTMIVNANDELTASRFNGLVFNLGGFKFPWQTDSSFPGFLGRKQVVGRYDFQIARKVISNRAALAKIQLSVSEVGWHFYDLSDTTSHSDGKDLSQTATLVPTSGLKINDKYILQIFTYSDKYHNYDLSNALKYAGHLVYCSVNNVTNFYYLQVLYDATTAKYQWYYYSDGWVPDNSNPSNTTGVYPNADCNAAKPVYVDEYGCCAQSMSPIKKARYYFNSQMYYTDGWAFIPSPDDESINLWYCFDSYGYCNGDGSGIRPQGTNKANYTHIFDARLYDVPLVSDYYSDYSYFWKRLNYNDDYSLTNLIRLANCISKSGTTTTANHFIGWDSPYECWFKYTDEEVEIEGEKYPLSRPEIPVLEYDDMAPYSSYFRVGIMELSEGWAYLPLPTSVWNHQLQTKYAWFYLIKGGDAYCNEDTDRFFNEIGKVDFLTGYSYEIHAIYGPRGLGWWYDGYSAEWRFLTKIEAVYDEETKKITDYNYYGYCDGWAKVNCLVKYSEMISVNYEEVQDDPPKAGKEWTYDDITYYLTKVEINEHESTEKTAWTYDCFGYLPKEKVFGKYSHWFYFDGMGYYNETITNDAFLSGNQVIVDWSLYGNASDFYMNSQGILYGPFNRDQSDRVKQGIPDKYVQFVFPEIDSSGKKVPRNTNYSISLSKMKSISSSASYQNGISNEVMVKILSTEDKNTTTGPYWFQSTQLPDERTEIEKWLYVGKTNLIITNYYGSARMVEKGVKLNIEGQSLQYPDIVYASYFKYNNDYPITDKLNALIRSLYLPSNVLLHFQHLLLTTSGTLVARSFIPIVVNQEVSQLLFKDLLYIEPSVPLTFLNIPITILKCTNHFDYSQDITKFITRILYLDPTITNTMESEIFNDLIFKTPLPFSLISRMHISNRYLLLTYLSLDINITSVINSQLASWNAIQGLDFIYIANILDQNISLKVIISFLDNINQLSIISNTFTINNIFNINNYSYLTTKSLLLVSTIAFNLNFKSNLNLKNIYLISSPSIIIGFNARLFTSSIKIESILNLYLNISNILSINFYTNIISKQVILLNSLNLLTYDHQPLLVLFNLKENIISNLNLQNITLNTNLLLYLGLISNIAIQTGKFSINLINDINYCSQLILSGSTSLNVITKYIYITNILLDYYINIHLSKVEKLTYIYNLSVGKGRVKRYVITQKLQYQASTILEYYIKQYLTFYYQNVYNSNISLYSYLYIYGLCNNSYQYFDSLFLHKVTNQHLNTNNNLNYTSFNSLTYKYMCEILYKQTLYIINNNNIYVTNICHFNFLNIKSYKMKFIFVVNFMINYNLKSLINYKILSPFISLILNRLSNLEILPLFNSVPCRIFTFNNLTNKQKSIMYISLPYYFICNIDQHAIQILNYRNNIYYYSNDCKSLSLMMNNNFLLVRQFKSVGYDSLFIDILNFYFKTSQAYINITPESKFIELKQDVNILMNLISAIPLWRSILKLNYYNLVQFNNFSLLLNNHSKLLFNLSSLILILKQGSTNKYISNYNNKVRFQSLKSKYYIQELDFSLNYSNQLNNLLLDDWIYPSFIDPGCLIRQTFKSILKHNRLIIY